MSTTHAYGWIPSRPDHRDRFYHLEETILRPRQLPGKVDLWPHVPPIWNQGALGSCTAHGSLRGWVTEAMRQGVSLPTPRDSSSAPLSRLMQYFDTRDIEGTTDTDSGGMVRDAIKVLATKGCAPESDWPYDIDRFTERPPAKAYADAQKYMSVKYQSVRVGGPGAPLRTALANGLAVVFGFSVPESFEDGSWDPATDVLPLPSADEGFVGGHCVALTGYDFTCKDHPQPFFLVDNSWGAGWGDNGRFRMDYRWFTPDLELATDVWVIQKVEA